MAWLSRDGEERGWLRGARLVRRRRGRGRLELVVSRLEMPHMPAMRRGDKRNKERAAVVVVERRVCGVEELK